MTSIGKIADDPGWSQHCGITECNDSVGDSASTIVMTRGRKEGEEGGYTGGKEGEGG